VDKKVLVVSEYAIGDYHAPFREFGTATTDSTLLWHDPESIALVVFTGGADVSPSLYGEEAATATHCVPRRDIYESISFQRAKTLNLPMVGICRGSQFLNVMAGGKLCQHLDGHNIWHDMTIIGNRNFEVSSTHHQMMLPPPDAKVIGWSTRKRSYVYLGEGNKALKPTPKIEYEVIYWPNLRAIGMQYHPEAMQENSRGFRFAAELVKKYLLEEV
jgi:GMP synthase-like glutamine amidotransferase